MFTTEFDSWFCTMYGCTCCKVKPDAGITYIVIFDTDVGVISCLFCGEAR